MTLIKYEIYTEAENVEVLKRLISKYLQCFTILDHVGYWKGVEEKSIKIEYIGIKQDSPLVMRLAENIKSYNQQEAVLVTMTKISGELV